MIGPSEFVPNGHTDPYLQTGVFIQMDSGGTVSSFFYAPLNLPDNAKITGMTVYYRDNSSKNIYITVLKEKQYDTGQLAVGIINWNSVGAVDSNQISKTTSVDFSFNKVVNSGSVYTIEVHFSNGGDGINLRLNAIKIWYSMT